MPKSTKSLVPITVLEAIADYFKILSETSRLHILQCLRLGPMNVMELCEETGLGQANLSKHLKVMTQAGILSRQAKGTSAYYEITDPLVFEFCELACGQIGDRLQQQAETFLQAASLQANSSTSGKGPRSQKTRTQEQASSSRR
ncbi:metalloregulator ArsR/SmtB family transcription factor (plasmid) [Kovacikia minuta CCNUW1]|uniref:ArsR/SmtB family transcription factor n=1 Tax=Kovacikia minuta TaxID=2931930 RepID=UPI001CCFD0B1|nr:metalloregulator ArsR/SmtB family transcription factor [Kovacikia minuta]UBF30632.1 metalloregulator ArsR/SmtB family transcription factor [Kovacikia minuta CCNUW1]